MSSELKEEKASGKKLRADLNQIQEELSESRAERESLEKVGPQL